MDAETYHRAVDLPGVRGVRLSTGRALPRRELQRLFAACAKDATAVGRRDAAWPDQWNAPRAAPCSLTCRPQRP